jgi:hypothetical protein
MNFLIETKQEYTIHLVNSIFSLVYDGLQNIYEEAKKNAKNNDELKIFQILLSGVPKWNPTIIDTEYQRILRLNNLGKTIEDLLKAVIKSNIVVLTNTNIDYNDQLLKELNIQDDFKNFIHLVYIECARSFYNTPFLFSHRDTPIDIKRNQTEILKIIQECIKNAVRKMIPLQITIKTYLENNNSKIPNDLESEGKQIKNLLKSEKMRRSDITPSSPRQLHDIIGTTVNSEEYRNGSQILKNNSKTFSFDNFAPIQKESNTEKTLRDSILNLRTEENKNQVNNSGSIFMAPGITKPKQKPSNMSESSVYYDQFEKNNNNVLEEYSNINKLHKLEEEEDEHEQQKPVFEKSGNPSFGTINAKSGNPVKYFSNLNI